MTKLPPEIDRLIWALAETNDSRAIEEFGERYPAYREALVERIKLVRRLRAAKPTREVPGWNYHPAPSQPRYSRGLGLVLAGAALASLAFATVTTLDRFVFHKQQPTESTKTGGPPPIQPYDGPSHPVKPSTEVIEPSVAPKGGTGQVGQAGETKADPFSKLVTVDHEHIKLSQLIKEIALQAGLKLEVAPGLTDDVVAAKYIGVPAIEALQDLGQNFGFSVHIEHDDGALLIPAIDPSKPPVTVPNGSFSEPAEAPKTGTEPVNAPKVSKQ
ncbi:MAG: hypothetical protein JSS66_03795 [Armatimonadetes bacterium]|nr:hypothetical protein [Armatimonadota bacterium]